MVQQRRIARAIPTPPSRTRLTLGKCAVDGCQEFSSRLANEEIIRPKDPAHVAAAIKQKGRGCVGVVMVTACSRVNDLHGFGELLFCIGDDHQVRKLGLRFLRIGRVIVRDDNHPDISAGKLLMMLLELTELDLANQSPAAPEEKKDRAFSVLEVLVGERCPIRERGGKGRNFLARLPRSGVQGRFGNHQDEEPFEHT